MNDWELIHKYCNGSESAFEALVKRYVDYVYCAALRQVRDPGLAEDVSQAVFMLLAQKAKTFRPDTILISWLFRATQNIAARAVRSELRRQRRESEAATMNPTTTMPDSDPQWERVSPVLDEALATLPNKDRDAVLLRFISRKPFSEVGAHIGASEDAAKKRVSRALGRLREFFLRRGTTLSVAAIGVMLGERIVHAAPVALSAKITTGILSTGAASTPAAALLKATLRDLFWNKMKWGSAIGAGVIAVLSIGITAIRHGSNHESTTTTLASAVLNQTLNDPKPVAAAVSVATTNAAGHTLSLLIVRAEDQQPVPGAHILVDSWIGARIKHLLDTHTDAKGILEFQVAEGAEMNIWISADGRVPMITQWHSHEFNVPVLSHSLSLEAGTPAGGTVLDEFGSPVPNAKVTFQDPGMDLGKRDNIAFHRDLSAVYTDVNGHWITTQYPPDGKAGLRIDSPAYVSVNAWRDDLKGFPTNITLVMSNGVALTGRITSTNGTPISNARVTKQNGSAYVVVKTDANGVFHLPHIERGQTFIDVDAEGFESIHGGIAWATNIANECTFTMTTVPKAEQPNVANLPQVKLRGTVVDADTGKPIPSFRVLLGVESLIRSDASLNNARLIGEGHDGKFEWQMARGGGFRLQAEADGYLAAVSEERGYQNAGDEFVFKLHSAVTLVGRVLTPDGTPAKNATLTLIGPNLGGVMQKPGQLIEPNPGSENARTRTDDEGNFRLVTKTGAHGVAIVHESGTALLTFEATTNVPVILQPWGVVEGALYLNGQPAPDQTVSLSGTEKADADPRITFFFAYSITTDANGHFRFDKALPGTNSVERWVGSASSGPAVVNSDLATNVEVKSGRVTSVELRRDGRPVIGRLVIQGSTNDIDWGMSEGSLSGKNKYPFALSKDGSIRADDVPPGTYKLSIELKLATAEPLMYSKTFGSVQKEIIIPSSENESRPVDLGDMTITQTK